MVRIYTDLAPLWPLISPVEDYAPQSQRIWHCLQSRLHTDRPRLLELGAGAGHGLCHLAERATCTAVDLSPAMLEQCRRLNPGVEAHVGDMRSIRLGCHFDAVLLHDSADYLLSAQDLRATLCTAAAHLHSGGALLVAPTYTRETFVNHQCEYDQRSRDGLVVTYLSYVHDPDPSDTTFELILHLLINEEGRVRAVDDRHACGLFGRDDWLGLLRAGGFDAEVLPDDLPWTMFAATKN